MSRIFKNSTFKMQLLVADDINTSIDGLSFKFHTTDPNIYVEVYDNFTLRANIATLTIHSTLFSALDEGVLTYEVRGFFNGEYVSIERQSSYFLKYSNSIPEIHLQEKYVGFNSNGYYEIYPDDGFNGMNKVAVDINVETGGGSCNLGQLHADFEDRYNGICWWHADEQGFDGFNYVEINASAYGDVKYNQGYNDGKNASQNAVEFEYLEPNQVVDLVLNQGFTGTFVIKGQITEVQSIDLKYGNSTYFLGDLKVFRGTGLNNSSIVEEDYFQVGDWVVIVGNVSNYNGTAQVDKGSTLVAKWREIPVTENKWGITGYFNNWGGTPDVYFEDPGFQLPFMDEWKDVRVVYGFETDGREIKIRYNNGLNHSYSAEIYNIPQIRPLIVSDMNMDLPANTYDVYLLGYNGEEKFEPQNILFVLAGTDINAFKLSDYLDIYNTYAPSQLIARNNYDGSEYSDTDTNMNIQVQFGNTITLRLNKSDGTIDERTIIYDGVTNSYIFN